MATFKLEIEIDTNGSAFEGDGQSEINRILERVYHRINGGESKGTLMDINGNTCGRFEVEES